MRQIHIGMGFTYMKILNVHIYSNFQNASAGARTHLLLGVGIARARVCACAVDNPVLERWRRLLKFFRAYESGFSFSFFFSQGSSSSPV